MGLTDQLMRLGGKLGVLRVASLPPASAKGPAKVRTREVTLAQLLTEIHGPEVRALADHPGELQVPFEQIGTVAGAPPASHGWTLARLRQTLQSAPYQGMDRAAAQKAILTLLAAAKVAPEELVREAMARDQAVDTFADEVRRKMTAHCAAQQAQLAELEARRRELDLQIAAAKQELAADHQRWQQWWAAKARYERDLAETVSPLLDKPVVTVDAQAPALA